MYNRKTSEKLLMELYGFQSTGEKHEENYFTRWHMNYYLFEKFGVDKRKAHYSSLINSGQMTRKEAMDLLTSCPIYPEIGLEKMIWKYEKRSHDDYRKDEKLWNAITILIRVLRKLSLK